MRKAILALLFAAMVAVPVMAADSAISGLLQVNLLKYEPYPAEPGQYIDAWFSIANARASDLAEGVSCTFVDNYPFALDSTEQRTLSLGQLQAGYDAIVRYRVRVDDKAVLGNNNIKVSCSSAGYPATQLSATVYVQAHDSVLALNEITAPDVAPGAKTPLVIKVKNMADAQLKDVYLKIDLSSTTTPFAAIGSPTEKRLATVDAGAEESFQYELMAYPNANPGVYKIPLTLTYSDRLGTTYTKTDYATVVVDSPAEIQLNLDSTELYKRPAKGSITLSVVNSGLSDVKALTVTLLPSADYTPLSAEEVYIGALSSDDSNTVDYTIYATNASTGNVQLLVRVSYVNAFNQRRSEDRNVAIPMYDNDQIAAMGLEPIAETNILILLVSLAVGAFIVYRLYKRFNKK